MPNLKDDYVTIVDKQGKQKRVLRSKDGNMLDVLQEGERLRVSLTDAKASRNQLTDAEKYVLADQQYRASTQYNRPGWRLADSKQEREDYKAVLDAAYVDAEKANAEAWRTLGGPNTEFRGNAISGRTGSRPGDPCTKDGRAGTLQYNGEGALVCVTSPTASPDPASDAAINDREAAYAEYNRHLATAYQTLGDGRKYQKYNERGGENGTIVEEDDPEERLSDAYRDHENYLNNSWRNTR